MKWVRDDGDSSGDGEDSDGERHNIGDSDDVMMHMTISVKDNDLS